MDNGSDAQSPHQVETQTDNGFTIDDFVYDFDVMRSLNHEPEDGSCRNPGHPVAS